MRLAVWGRMRNSPSAGEPIMICGECQSVARGLNIECYTREKGREVRLHDNHSNKNGGPGRPSMPPPPRPGLETAPYTGYPVVPPPPRSDRNSGPSSGQNQYRSSGSPSYSSRHPPSSAPRKSAPHPSSSRHKSGHSTADSHLSSVMSGLQIAPKKSSHSSHVSSKTTSTSSRTGHKKKHRD